MKRRPDLDGMGTVSFEHDCGWTFTWAIDALYDVQPGRNFPCPQCGNRWSVLEVLRLLPVLRSPQRAK